MDEINLEDVRTPEEFNRALNALRIHRNVTIVELSAKSGRHESLLRTALSGNKHLPPRQLFGSLIRAITDDPVELVEWDNAYNRVRHGKSESEYGLGHLIPTAPSREGLKQAEEELVANSENLELGLLWGVTHERLDYYHEIATGQARVSFRNAQIAMAAGFVFLVAFAIMALYARSTAVSIVAGVLGAVGAAFAGYISRTFVQSQQSSAAHLRSYFDQPLELSRYLAAERVISSMKNLGDEQRTQLARDLVQGIVASPPAASKDDKGAKKDNS